MWAETEFRNLTPEQRTREIFVVGIFFDHLKCGNRQAKDVTHSPTCVYHWFRVWFRV
jgi:hypothetical protein